MLHSIWARMFPVQVRASWACWMARNARWYRSLSSRPKAAVASPMAPAFSPSRTSGRTIWVCHHSACDSATRRRLSPRTRSSRSVACASMPRATCASRSGTTSSSSSRTRSSDCGVGAPVASRMVMSMSTGIPVFSLSCAKVIGLSVAKRSNSGLSMKSSDTSRLRMSVPSPSTGIPARSRVWTRPMRRASPAVNRSPSVGARIPRSTRRVTSSSGTPARSAVSWREKSVMPQAYPLTDTPSHVPIRPPARTAEPT